MVHNRNLIAYFFGFFQIMRDQNDRHTSFLVQSANIVPKRLPQFDINAGYGFIQNQYLSTVHQCFCQEQALAHATG